MSEHNKTQQDFNGDFNTLLIRIDERTKNLAEQIESVCSNTEEIKKDLKANYVSQTEFLQQISPLKAIVYGAVKVILLSVLTAILYLVIRG